MFRDLGGIVPNVEEDDGCVELTDAEKECLMEGELGGEIMESVGRVVSARFGLTPEEDAAGNVYDPEGWNMLEFQGRVGGKRFLDGNKVLRVFEKLIYFKDKDFPGYAAALAKFAGSPGLVTFGAEGPMVAGFAVGFNLRGGKTDADVAELAKQLEAGEMPNTEASEFSSEDPETKLEIDLGNVAKEDGTGWREVRPDEVVPAKDAFLFDWSMMSAPKRRFVYSAHVDSVNRDENLSYDDRITADRPQSIKQLFEAFWKRLPKGFGVSADMNRAHAEFSRKVEAAKAASGGDSAAFALAMMDIPFPVMSQLWYGRPEDGVAIVPSKEMCDRLTAEGKAAGYFESDDSTELVFNKPASDRIWVRRVLTGGLGESGDKKVKPFFKN